MKKLLLLLLLVFSCSFFNLYAQLSQGEMAIGGTNYDVGNSIIQTYDKGFAIAGSTISYGAGSEDIYVIKLDSAGNLKWTKTIGGTNDDEGWSIVQTYDKGLAIAGYTRSYGAGLDDAYVIKLDSTGNLKWTKTIGGTNGDDGYSIIQTYDKGLAIAGTTGSYGAGNADVYVIKLDSAGNLKWTKTIGGTIPDGGWSIIQTYDKGLAIAGYTDSYGAGSEDVYVIKLDSAGSLKWTKTIGGTNTDYAYSIIETSDKGLAIAGWTISYGAGNGDVYVIKLDSAGNLKWTKTIGGTNTDGANSIIETSDKGLAIAGSTNSYGAGNEDAYVIKLDSAGNLKWTKTIGGTNTDGANSIIETSDKGLAIVGLTNSYGAGSDDVYVIKLDSAGNLCHSFVSDSGMVSSGGAVSSGGTESSGGMVSNGDMVSSGGIMTNVCSVITSVNSLYENNNAALYPNPNKGVFALQIANGQQTMANSRVEIYNMIGEKVFTSPLSPLQRGSSSQTQIDLHERPAGIYLYRVITETGDLVSEGKFIIQK